MKKLLLLLCCLCCVSPVWATEPETTSPPMEVLTPEITEETSVETPADTQTPAEPPAEGDTEPVEGIEEPLPEGEPEEPIVEIIPNPVRLFLTTPFEEYTVTEGFCLLFLICSFCYFIWQIVRGVLF